ncbi:MAG: [FeFe] hydrogenase H-cluster radical SAM maturase HydE [Firmicutes bacterium]|nr:[FeFe] hydrogenase H-cluster radical SAM maturase HydE [Bacillota bacterium]
METLFAAADRVRQEQVGDAIWLRGLIEFSSYCRHNCHYCGLRRDNRQASRYRLTAEQILAAVEQVAAAGLGTVVLQSGEDTWWTIDRLQELIRAIKEQHPQLAITLSIGERSYAEYAALRQAGADRFLLRFETSNPKLSAQLHPGNSLSQRLECLQHLQQLGYEVGSGCLVGLPGQTLADLANDLLLIKNLNLPMVGIGPFIPHPQTPLGRAAAGSVDLTLKMLALTRLLLPTSNIPVTTALATLDKDGRQRGWQAGANVVMPNATPEVYWQQYQLYPGKAQPGDSLRHSLNNLRQQIQAAGRYVGQGPGSALGRKEANHAENTPQ